MKVDNRDPRPAYIQIADALRTEIRSGELSPGDRLPATRLLAEQAGAAKMTVRKALDLLVAEGFIVGQRGRGIFVASAEPHVGRLVDADVRAALADLDRRVADLEQQLRDSRGKRKG